MELYEKRLRRVHHNYQAFSLQSSVDQQNTYLKLADNIKEKNINIVKIPMDDYKKGYKRIINRIPVLKENNIVYK